MKCFKKQRNIKGALTLAPKNHRERVKGHSLSVPSLCPALWNHPGVFFYGTSDTHVCLCCSVVSSHMHFGGGEWSGF